MSETLEAPARRKPIQRESFRQEKAVVFARDAVVCPHIFMSHDRGKNSGREHLWQAKRGVRKGTPDTQLIIRGRHYWFEFKAGNAKPDEDQLQMLANLAALGDAVAWGRTIAELCEFWRINGVPLVTNAAYRAMVLDGLVESRIAKAEGATPATKKPSRRKPTVKTSSLAWARRNGVWRP